MEFHFSGTTIRILQRKQRHASAANHVPDVDAIVAESVRSSLELAVEHHVDDLDNACKSVPVCGCNWISEACVALMMEMSANHENLDNLDE